MAAAREATMAEHEATAFKGGGGESVHTAVATRPHEEVLEEEDVGVNDRVAKPGVHTAGSHLIYYTT